MSVWEACDMLATAEVTVSTPSGFWPAMVAVECEPMTITTDDARRLALALLAGAERADALTDAYRDGAA